MTIICRVRFGDFLMIGLWIFCHCHLIARSFTGVKVAEDRKQESFTVTVAFKSYNDVLNTSVQIVIVSETPEHRSEFEMEFKTKTNKILFFLPHTQIIFYWFSIKTCVFSYLLKKFHPNCSAFAITLNWQKEEKTFYHSLYAFWGFLLFWLMFFLSEKKMRKSICHNNVFDYWFGVFRFQKKKIFFLVDGFSTNQLCWRDLFWVCWFLMAHFFRYVSGLVMLYFLNWRKFWKEMIEISSC